MTIVFAWLAFLAAQQSAADPPVPVTPGTIAIRTDDAGDPRVSAALQPYADAVESALLDRGFTVIPSADHARYVATVSASQEGKGAVAAKARSGGADVLGAMGGAMGGGVSLGLPTGKTALGELVATEIDVSIARRGSTQSAWQGRAVTHQVAGTRRGDTQTVATKLATALFRNFPQGSGLTVSVP